jgi:septal ring-binding cell division protein DamX
VTTSNKQVDRNVSLRPTTSETKPETVLPQPSPEPAEAPIPESERLPQSKPQPSFCIVLASQTTHRLAEDFIDRMKKGGHDEVRMINMQNSKKVRVVYGSYPSEQDAYEKLRQMRKLNDFKDAWVLKLTPVQ